MYGSRGWQSSEHWPQAQPPDQGMGKLLRVLVWFTPRDDTDIVTGPTQLTPLRSSFRSSRVIGSSLYVPSNIPRIFRKREVRTPAPGMLVCLMRSHCVACPWKPCTRAECSRPSRCSARTLESPPKQQLRVRFTLDGKRPSTGVMHRQDTLQKR